MGWKGYNGRRDNWLALWDDIQWKLFYDWLRLDRNPKNKNKFVDFQINKIVIELLKGQVKHLDKNGEVVRVSKFGKNHFEAPLVYRIDLEGQIKKKIGQEMTKNDIWLNYTKETWKIIEQHTITKNSSTICNEDVKNPVYPSCNHKCCKKCLIEKVSLEAFVNECPICQRKIFLRYDQTMMLTISSKWLKNHMSY